MSNTNVAKNVVVIGTQWGDEGKGRIVAWLTDHAAGVVRFQGGHNAGHTLVTWRLSFHRKYDPYWYFGTLQRYAVGLVAEELIAHAATPGT